MARHHVQNFGASPLTALKGGKYLVAACLEREGLFRKLVGAPTGIAECIGEGQPAGLGTGPQSKSEFIAEPLPRRLICMTVHMSEHRQQKASPILIGLAEGGNCLVLAATRRAGCLRTS